MRNASTSSSALHVMRILLIWSLCITQRSEGWTSSAFIMLPSSCSSSCGAGGAGSAAGSAAGFRRQGHHHSNCNPYCHCSYFNPWAAIPRISSWRSSRPHPYLSMSIATQRDDNNPVSSSVTTVLPIPSTETKTVKRKKAKTTSASSDTTSTTTTTSPTASTSTTTSNLTAKKKSKTVAKKKKKTITAIKTSSTKLLKTEGKTKTKTKTKRKATSTKSKTAQIKTKTPKVQDEPIHFYRHETDAITILDSNTDADADANTAVVNATIVKFTVRGNPVPLARHRTYRGFIFNPSAKKQRQFCNVVLDMLPNSYFQNHDASTTTRTPIDTSTGTHARTDAPDKILENVIPIFQEVVISVKIICRMKRPMKHFISNKPGPGRLRTCPANNGTTTAHEITSHLQVTRTDVDNLAKFVLDSLNGVLYGDDRQVASLQVVKVYDDEEPWTGSTHVVIRTMVEEDLYEIAGLNG